MQPRIAPCSRWQAVGVTLLLSSVFPPDEPGFRPAQLARSWWALDRRRAQNTVLAATAPDTGEVVGCVEVHSRAYLRSVASGLNDDQAARLRPYVRAAHMRACTQRQPSKARSRAPAPHCPRARQLASLAVAPRYRGRGIGRDLLLSALTRVHADETEAGEVDSRVMLQVPLGMREPMAALPIACAR